MWVRLNPVSVLKYDVKLGHGIMHKILDDACNMQN